MPTAYSYIRFSTPAQRKGDSLRRQLEASAAYAAHHGLTLDTTYRDLGLSGFKGINRVKGALGAFLRAVESGEIEAGSFLIVENLDRLTREEIVDALSTFLNVIASGITVVTLMDKQIYSRETVNANPMLLLISITILARGNEESRTKAERLATTWTNKGKQVATGGSRQKWTSVVPFWLLLEGRDRHERLVAPWTVMDGLNGHPNLVALIERIYELALSLGSESITRILNGEAVPAPKRRDGWHASTVKFLLSDRRVLGELQLYTNAAGSKRQAVGEPIPNYFPQIIPAHLFYAVQKAVASRRCGTGGGQRGKRPNLFTSLTRCECGRAMEYRNKGSHPRGRYLICSGYHRKRGCENHYHYVYDELEKVVLDFVTDVEIPDEVANKATVAGLRLLGKQGERDHIEAQIARCRRDLIEEDDPREVLALKSTRRALRAKADNLDDEIVALTIEANTGKRPVMDDRRAALKQLRHQMSNMAGTELFQARSRLAAALGGIIDFITFEPDGEFTVVVEGGLKAYRFRDGHFLEGIDHTADPTIEHRSVQRWVANRAYTPVLAHA